MMTQGQNYRLKQIRAELEDFKLDRPDLKDKIEAVEAKIEKALLSSDEGDAWVIISNWYNYDWDNGNRESNLINFIN